MRERTNVTVNVTNEANKDIFFHVEKPRPATHSIPHNPKQWNTEIELSPLDNVLEFDFYREDANKKKSLTIDSLVITSGRSDIGIVDIQEVEDPSTKETVRKMVVQWATGRKPTDPPDNVNVGVKE